MYISSTYANASINSTRFFLKIPYGQFGMDAKPKEDYQYIILVTDSVSYNGQKSYQCNENTRIN